MLPGFDRSPLAADSNPLRTTDFGDSLRSAKVCANMRSVNAQHNGWLWDDIRFFLAICREGSLSAAARCLGVDHSTVGRRLVAFERQLGAKLANRTPEGLLLTATGREILADCENMEAAAFALQRRAAGQDRHTAGLLSVATTESLAFQLVVPALSELRSTHPELQINLLVDFHSLDLSRRQADLAVRPPQPTEAHLVCRKLGAYGFALYASRPYLAKRGTPHRGEGLHGHSLITYLDRVSGPGSPFLGETFDQKDVVFKSNSTFAQLAAVANGLGMADLPCCIADAHGEVQRVWPEEQSTPYPIWLITHEDLRRATKIRLVSSAIVRQYERRRRILRDGTRSRK
jgi:DNA-binding transcriptional LysR family regulator